MWSSASRVFASFDMHLNHAGGCWPKGATYRSAASWLPAASVALRRLRRAPQPDLARARPRTPGSQKAATTAVTGPEQWAVVTASTTVTKDHSLASWLFPRLVIALLDTPDHMTT